MILFYFSALMNCFNDVAASPDLDGLQTTGHYVVMNDLTVPKCIDYCSTRVK